MSSRSWKVRRYLTAIAIAAAPQVVAAADLGGTFLCIDEFGGGIAYEAAQNGWVSAKFRAEGKLVLKATWLGERPWYKGSTTMADYYEVSVSQMGEKAPYPCTSLSGNDGRVSASGTILNCSAGLSDYRFNLDNMRFLVVYPIGYVDGRDDNDNTPSIMGGTCAKID